MDTTDPSRAPRSLTPPRETLSTGPSSSQTPQPGAQKAPWRSDLQHPPTSHPPQSTASSSPLTAMSPSATDRVFPVRSVVSLDPTPTPLSRVDAHGGDGFPGMSTPSARPLNRKHSPESSLPKQPPSPTPDLGSDRPGPFSSRNSTIRHSHTSSQHSCHDGDATQAQSQRSSTDHERQPDPENNSNLSDTMATRPQAPSSHSENETRSIRSAADNSVGKEDDTGGLVTARFKHIVTDGGHAVIVGRDGETLQRCEDEPIHMPGAVQGFGLLLALKEVDDKLQIRMVSENAKRILGYTPKQLFELETFCDILSEEQSENLLDHIDFISDEDADPATNGPEVFTISIRAPSHKVIKLWCAMHIIESNRDLIICEFELEDDTMFPLAPVGEATPEPPEDTLECDPTPEELAESTVNASKPLRVLRSARKRKGEAAAMEVFNIMSQVQEQMASAESLDSFLKILVGVVKELTGFHRVMIYQFDASWNGRVVTELVDPRATKDLYKGLNFPASDIPKQARDLYKINKVRLLYDRDQETARLVCRTLEDLQKPLDLTFAYLRAMSPIHIKYLANMAVRASMSISINAFNELWGLIACHSYGAKGMRVSFPIRKMCRMVGDSASRNIERLSYASRLQSRKLINTVPTETNPSGYIIASSDDLLKLFDADFGVLSIRDETKTLGKIDQTQEALAMLEYLRLRRITTVTSSTDVRIDFPDLRYEPGFSVIAGLLLVPLSVSGGDFIVFFRRGQIREVKWAGNPYEKFVKQGTEGFLEPRKSFKTWSETIVGRCRDWTEEQIETAAVLCLVYGKFIEVWRQKEAALQNSNLTKLLLANSAHEVRTPLNAIINYLEIALEGSIDQETRDNLSRSHSASKSLIYVINDLLDLTKTEEGHDLIKDELFDLPATVREATESFAGDAKRKGIEYETIEHPGLPQHVIGDQRRVRQAIFNITANAIQHTSSGSVRIEMWLANRRDNRVDIDILIEDTGCGMGTAKLDALFNDLEQVQSENDEGQQGNLDPTMIVRENKPEPKKVLGLGLALVARIVRNMNGQLRLKSEEGKGSRFIVQFGFELPADEGKMSLLQGLEKAGVAPPSDHPTTPSVEQGEVMLVKSAQKKEDVQKRAREAALESSHRKSTDSVHSLASMKSFKSGSSGKSEVDRLIDAIQEPHMVGKAPTDDTNLMSPTHTNGRSLNRPGSSSSSKTGPSRRGSTGILHPKQSATGLDRQHGPGTHMVTDSKTPVKPIRMPDDSSMEGQQAQQPVREFPPRTASRVLFDVPDKGVQREEPLNADKLCVLVAEDDPINSKIMKKRLEKAGHEVHLTINGEECSSSYGEKPAFFDVVLMDMQMPIVDGLTSTKMIRSFEKSSKSHILSQRAAINGRVPIFAVSASLLEKERQVYIDGGFDGWILKPIDFKRLGVLLDGIVQEHTRHSCLYEPGQWERGGWFCQRQPDVFSLSTAPSPDAPVTTTASIGSYPEGPTNSSEDEERDRLNQLDNDAVHAHSTPREPGSSGSIAQSTEKR